VDCYWKMVVGTIVKLGIFCLKEFVNIPCILFHYHNWSDCMKILSLIRGIFVLLVIPLNTIVSSLLAILFLVVFRCPAVKARVIPRTWAKIMLIASGVKVRVEGLGQLDPDRAYIFTANHQSQFDIFAMQGSFNFDFRWLAKKELFDIPLFGRAMRQSGGIPIDRSRGRQAVKSLNEAAQRIADGTSVVIFPEGTRSTGGKLLPFKTGGMVLAVKSGVPLVPVAICGTDKILPKGKLLTRSGEVVIRVGEPIETKEYTVKQKLELAEEIRERVEQLLIMNC